MLNGIHERGMSKDENSKVKIWKYPGASSIYILDHIKPSLRKAPEQITIHAGTKHLTKMLSMFKVDNKDTRTTLFIVLLIAYFTPCSSVSIVNFEHVIASRKTVH